MPLHFKGLTYIVICCCAQGLRIVPNALLWVHSFPVTSAWRAWVWTAGNGGLVPSECEVGDPNANCLPRFCHVSTFRGSGSLHHIYKMHLHRPPIGTETSVQAENSIFFWRRHGQNVPLKSNQTHKISNEKNISLGIARPVADVSFGGEGTPSHILPLLRAKPLEYAVSSPQNIPSRFKPAPLVTGQRRPHHSSPINCRQGEKGNYPTTKAYMTMSQRTCRSVLSL